MLSYPETLTISTLDLQKHMLNSKNMSNAAEFSDPGLTSL